MEFRKQGSRLFEKGTSLLVTLNAIHYFVILNATPHFAKVTATTLGLFSCTYYVN